MFFGPYFWGENPQFLDLVYKIAPISDHVLKFRGDRPRDRGDLAPNKKKQQQNNDCGCVIETGGPKNWQSKNCNVHSWHCRSTDKAAFTNTRPRTSDVIPRMMFQQNQVDSHTFPQIPSAAPCPSRLPHPVIPAVIYNKTTRIYNCFSTFSKLTW